MASLPPGTIVSVRFLEIKEGISKADAIKAGIEATSAYNAAQPDVQWLITDVVRSEHAGHLGMLTVMDNAAIHDSYWPAEGPGGTEKWTKITEMPSVKAADAKMNSTFNLTGADWSLIGDFVVK